jgi:subtilase family serine protease
LQNRRYDTVKPLGAGAERTESFRYKWTCTGESDEIKVCADYKEAVAESDETNNCRTVIWECDRRS